MGILDKLTKVLRKVTPKEIAPALPFLATLVPGLGLAGTGVFGQYVLPQLLTAAGSARESGDISLMNQLMTLGASYAAGPGGSKASELQDAFAKKAPQTEMLNASRSARGASSLGQVSKPTLAASNPAAYARSKPDLFKQFKLDNPNIKNSLKGNLREKFLQNMNKGLTDPFSLEGLMTYGGIGGSQTARNYARRKENEFEQEEEERMGKIGRYRDATAALSDYFLNTDYSLEDIYGKGNVPGFLMNKGGRVGLAGGGMDDGQRKSGGTTGTNNNNNNNGGNKNDDRVSPGQSMAMAGNVSLAGMSQAEASSAIGMGQDGDTNNTTLQPYTPYDFDQEDLNLNEYTPGPEMDLGAFINKINPLSQTFTYGDEDEVSYGYSIDPFTGEVEVNAGIEFNQGGRVGMNMGGGLGSIPQTPMVPQGMQLDGRGGGFIPMGAQEKKDDVPAMLAKNEFVMTSDAVRAAGGGSVEKGAQRMYDLMNKLEAQV